MNKQEKLDRRYALAAIIFGIAISYTGLSANCAAGGRCDFASGHFANWLFSIAYPALRTIEWVFWTAMSVLS